MSKLVLRVIVVFFLVGTVTLAKQEKHESPGLEVGKRAPDFELKDQLGKPKRLSTILKAGPAAIVFHRSAKW